MREPCEGRVARRQQVWAQMMNGEKIWDDPSTRTVRGAERSMGRRTDPLIISIDTLLIQLIRLMDRTAHPLDGFNSSTGSCRTITEDRMRTISFCWLATLPTIWTRVEPCRACVRARWNGNWLIHVNGSCPNHSSGRRDPHNPQSFGGNPE